MRKHRRASHQKSEFLMTTTIVAQSPLIFNNKSIPEVYRAIKHVHGDINASQMVPAIVLPFIPKDACPQQWARTLRNYEYNLSKKTKTRKRARSAGAEPRGHSPARLVLSGLEVVS
jgi:hypothetical protein